MCIYIYIYIYHYGVRELSLFPAPSARSEGGQLRGVRRGEEAMAALGDGRAIHMRNLLGWLKLASSI